MKYHSLCGALVVLAVAGAAVAPAALAKPAPKQSPGLYATMDTTAGRIVTVARSSIFVVPAVVTARPLHVSPVQVESGHPLNIPRIRQPGRDRTPVAGGAPFQTPRSIIGIVDPP